MNHNIMIDKQKRYYSVREVAESLNLKPQQIYTWINRFSNFMSGYKMPTIKDCEKLELICQLRIEKRLNYKEIDKELFLKYGKKKV